MIRIRNRACSRKKFLDSSKIANAVTETESLLAISLDRNGDSIHRGDPIKDGKSMFRGEMTIACGHRNGLVAAEFLNFLD